MKASKSGDNLRPIFLSKAMTRMLFLPFVSRTLDGVFEDL